MPDLQDMHKLTQMIDANLINHSFLGKAFCPLPIRIVPGLNGPLWEWSPRMSLSAARKLVFYGVREHAQRIVRLPP